MRNHVPRVVIANKRFLLAGDEMAYFMKAVNCELRMGEGLKGLCEGLSERLSEGLGKTSF